MTFAFGRAALWRPSCDVSRELPKAATTEADKLRERAGLQARVRTFSKQQGFSPLRSKDLYLVLVAMVI
jgi:hypothetical protein